MDYRKTLAINAAIVVALLLGLIVILKTISKRLERKEAEKEQAIQLPDVSKRGGSARVISEFWDSIPDSQSVLSYEDSHGDFLRNHNRDLKRELYLDDEPAMVDYLVSEDSVHVSDESVSVLIFPYEIDEIGVSDDSVVEVEVNDGNRSFVAVRAKRPFSKTTSLTAISSYGKVYSYILDYVKTPSKTILCAERGELQSIAKVDTVEVSDNYTIHLDFSNTIDFFVYQKKYFLTSNGIKDAVNLEVIENHNSILRMKASIPFDKTEQLTVVDEKGFVYPFIVKYGRYPGRLTVSIREPGVESRGYLWNWRVDDSDKTLLRMQTQLFSGFCCLATLVLILFVIVITQRVRIKNCRKGINHINWQIELLERYRKDLQQKLNGSPADEWNQENSKNGYEKKYINKSYPWNECVSVSFRLNNDEALYRMAFESTSGHLVIYSDVPVPRRVVEVVERALNDELDREELWSELSLALSLPVDFLKDTIIVSDSGWVHLKESDATFLSIWPNSVFAEDVIKGEHNRLWYLFRKDEKTAQKIFDPGLFHPESDGAAFGSGEPFDESDALVPTDMDGPSAVDFDSEEHTDV